MTYVHPRLIQKFHEMFNLICNTLFLISHKNNVSYTRKYFLYKFFTISCPPEGQILENFAWIYLNSTIEKNMKKNDILFHMLKKIKKNHKILLIRKTMTYVHMGLVQKSFYKIFK